MFNKNILLLALFLLATFISPVFADDGNGSVTVDPVASTYCTGTVVTLTPVPDCEYAFDDWSGDDSGDIIDTDGIYTIVMDDDKEVTANFAAAALPYLEGEASSDTADDVSGIQVSHTTGTCADRLMLVGVWYALKKEEVLYI